MTAIDECVDGVLHQYNAEFRNQCSDEVFVRRTFLDVIGTLPTPEETQAFLDDASLNKRNVLINSLLERDEFAQYWSMKWCDLLRVKSEFPINLWPNAVQAYHRWIYEAIRGNMPYDQFARALLTSSGSNFRVPAVNFYRAVPSREPQSIAKAVALTFMGERMENWTDKRKTELATFFSRVAYKKTNEWKEEIVYSKTINGKQMPVIYPDGATSTLSTDEDPRQRFTDWLVHRDNPWFAKNITNRIWSWLMGYGIIHEPDDIRPDNPNHCPPLLSYLERELIASNYDLRHVFRLILNSRTYQQTSIYDDATTNEKLRFARYRIRRLDAEVLLDALLWVGSNKVGYSSAIPEPFTFIPPENRTIMLADGSITSPFLATFGRSSRDTGLETERDNNPTDVQRLYLLNSVDILQGISNSQLLRKAITSSRNNRTKLVTSIYLIILSRYPTAQEQKVALEYLSVKGLQLQKATSDLAWALINSKEFLYRH